MTAMTDSRAVEVLEDIRAVWAQDEEESAALDHAIARLREPAEAQVPALIVDHVTDSHAWPLMNIPSGTRLYAAAQPPAEAQAQGGGEVVAWFPTNGRGEIIRTYGDGSPVYACKTKEEAEQAKRCHLGATGPVIPLYTAPPSAPVEVEFDGTDREVLREFIRLCREVKPVGRWPGERVCAAIERSMANERPFRFIAEADMSPERGHNGRGGDGDRAFSGPRRPLAQQPAAVDGANTVDWRAMYRFQTAMRYMDNNPQLTKERAYKMADDDCATLAAQPGGGA